MSKTIPINKSVKDANQETADAARAELTKHRVFCLNLLSAPGSGKTSLIEQTIRALSGRYRVGVIVGDIATDQDAKRIAKAGAAQSEQIETDGACHLVAKTVYDYLGRFDLSKLDILFIENVGNLVCPVGWDLGEHARAVLISVPEGDDKPSKYPTACVRTDALILTKIDVLSAFEFDPARAEADARRLNPKLDIFPLSARTGEGMDAWLAWLEDRIEQFRETSV